MQLAAIASRPITSYLGEKTNTHLTTTYFQAVAESDKVSPQPPLLQKMLPVVTLGYWADGKGVAV